jgi:hypothetical protein
MRVWKNKMENKTERIKVGDTKINSQTGKPEICVDCLYWKDGYSPRWEDYEAHLLHTRMGMSPGSMVHTLEYFMDVLNASKLENKREIKIRYAYIASPTTLRIDPGYNETLEFKVLTVEGLETRSIKTTLEELITENETALIKILGRDLCLNRVDRNGHEIYERDILRWFLNDGSYYDEEVDMHSPFNELETERDCNVIGNSYETNDRKSNKKWK